MNAPDRELAMEIAGLYDAMQDIKAKGHQVSKPYLILFYNLHLLDLKKQAFSVLDELEDDYFSSYLINDMHASVRLSKKYDEYKEKTDPRSLAIQEKCKNEFDFFVVAVRSLLILARTDDFRHKEDFGMLLKQIGDEKFDLPMGLAIF